MTTKVFGIKEKDFFEFIKKINEFYSKNNAFSTQTYQDKDFFYAVVYFRSNKESPPEANSPSLAPPTARQVAFIKKFQERIPETKGEAWRVIKEYIDHQQEI